MVIDTPPETAPPTGEQRLAIAIATAAGAGYAPVAPGTFGSAAGVLLYLPMSFIPLWSYTAITVLLLVIGVWAAEQAEHIYQQKDDGRIVIDEVVGQLLTLAPLLVIAPEHARSPWLLLVGFLLFRALDIWKPGPVRWAERNFPGGAGVMLDDVVAGLFGLLVMIPVALGARA